MLKIEELEAGYGERPILFGVDMHVDKGEVVLIAGANGSGKSTVMKSIVGLTSISKGKIELKGENITRMPTDKIVAAGIGFVPQNDNIFPNLSVEENLKLGCYLAKKVNLRVLAEVYELFPALKENYKQNASYLSGGQRQMLAIGRVLMMDCELLMLDEPSAGLSPKFMDLIFNSIHTISQVLKKTFLIVEQNVKLGLSVADRYYVLAEGANALDGRTADIESDDRISRILLGN